ncbi:ubiquitin carboxyl-terminal esterase L3 [Hesseltinella vesiculosa]|uniref:Ubiquitin carboxyl-terminal hydrolase n=1 Tax=Hesseltinella vesiculosa TaxID=101127 RepID=A0A1X2G305_9FUNG|nr:ubiquitin carboxyl-terminal esterase L3 [Hesseltinella vesiculosa]
MKWLPLEANPEVWNNIIHKNGISESLNFSDVYGFDPELLAFVPQPVEAVIFLFPITEAYESHRCLTHEQILQTQPNVKEDTKHIQFFKQTISNACGIIGLLHALANNKHKPGLFKDSNELFPTIIRDTENMSSDDRAVYLEKCSSLAEVHAQGAQEGQTETPSLDEHINLHFICFVDIDGELYELDGRQDFPISHGPIKASLLDDTVTVMKAFMSRDTQETNFSAIALSSD